MNSAEAARRAQASGRQSHRRALRRMARGIRCPTSSAFVQTLQIEDKVTGGLIDFSLWDFQQELIADLASHDRFWCSRRASWASPGRCWPTCSTGHLLGRPPVPDLLADRRRCHRRPAPSAHPARLDTGEVAAGQLKDNTQQIAFANGSRFEALMATTRAGRGKAPYIAVLRRGRLLGRRRRKAGDAGAGSAAMIYASPRATGPTVRAQDVAQDPGRRGRLPRQSSTPGGAPRARPDVV